jgi:hypothetical protein
MLLLVLLLLLLLLLAVALVPQQWRRCLLHQRRLRRCDFSLFLQFCPSIGSSVGMILLFVRSDAGGLLQDASSSKQDRRRTRSSSSASSSSSATTAAVAASAPATPNGVRSSFFCGFN